MPESTEEAILSVAQEPEAPILNVANVQRLIGKLTDLANAGRHDKFKMSTYGSYINYDYAIQAGLTNGLVNSSRYHECNTACCMAGWANVINLHEDHGTPLDEILIDHLANADAAMEWLGLTKVQARALFGGTWNATPLQGIRVLENLIKYSEVNWHLAMREVEALNNSRQPQ